MKRITFIGLVIFLTNLSSFVYSQQSPLQFGVMTREEFEHPLYPNETGAEAVVLLDYADAHISFSRSTSEDQTGFKVESNHHVRIKILKSSGYDYANMAITYPDDDKFYGLKAMVYNMENGEIVGTELKRKDFNTEKTTDNYRTIRFTFPMVKEGSVIEYTYEHISSDIYEFMPFTLQWEIPVRHSEFWATYPEYFIYNIKRNGFNLIKEAYSAEKGYFNTTTATFNVYRWTGDNLPAFQAEPYLPALHEYMAGIQFELAGVNFPGGTDAYASPTYKRYTERLMQSAYFGQSLNNYLLFLGQVNKITKGMTDPYEKMKALYAYIRNNIKWDGRNSFLLSKSLKKTVKDKNGNSADINLLLINMLYAADISVYPVILSTRDHGTLNKYMAFDGNFDYVICYAEIKGKTYLLDATNNDLPLGYLPDYCMNGEGWLVSENRGKFVQLQTDENNYYSGTYNFSLQPDGTINGLVDLKFDGYIGYEIRNDLKNLGIEDFRLNILIDDGRIKCKDFEINGVDSMDNPVDVKFELETSDILQSTGDILFFNPYNLYLLEFENNFVKEEREFPVNRPCPEFRSYIFTIDVPETFSIEEVPRAMKLSLPDGDAQFTFSVNIDQNTIVINGNLQVRKTYYEPQEYPSLREFYTQMFRKMNEMIILKKKESLSQL